MAGLFLLVLLVLMFAFSIYQAMHIQSMFELGQSYFEGNGVEKNYEKAV
jgi:TPR repeat protein